MKAKCICCEKLTNRLIPQTFCEDCKMIIYKYIEARIRLRQIFTGKKKARIVFTNKWLEELR